MDATTILSAAVPYVPHALATGGFLLALWWRMELAESRRARAADAQAAAQALTATNQAAQQSIQDAQKKLHSELESMRHWLNGEAERLAHQSPDLAQEHQRAQARIAQLEAMLNEQASLLQTTQERLKNATAMADRLKRQKRQHQTIADINAHPQ